MLSSTLQKEVFVLNSSKTIPVQISNFKLLQTIVAREKHYFRFTLRTEKKTNLNLKRAIGSCYLLIVIYFFSLNEIYLLVVYQYNIFQQIYTKYEFHVINMQKRQSVKGT